MTLPNGRRDTTECPANGVGGYSPHVTPHRWLGRFLLLTRQRSAQLRRTLMVPLCGEPRMAFCYPHAGREQQFEAYVRERLSREALLLPSSQLLEEGWFGKGAPDPRLLHRIGVYTLVMRDNWTIIDRLPGEKPVQHTGVHGGVSAQEMYVPLIYAEC